jgi:hypothetical protein
MLHRMSPLARNGHGVMSTLSRQPHSGHPRLPNDPVGLGALPARGRCSARIIAMVAIIGSPPCSPISNSTSAAACHSAASCSALGSFGDVERCVAERDQRLVLRQRDRFVEFPLPALHRWRKDNFPFPPSRESKTAIPEFTAWDRSIRLRRRSRSTPIQKRRPRFSWSRLYRRNEAGSAKEAGGNGKFHCWNV